MGIWSLGVEGLAALLRLQVVLQVGGHVVNVGQLDHRQPIDRQTHLGTHR